MFGVFVLTTAISIEMSRGPTGKDQDAIKALGKATYVQTGTDKIVKNAERKYTPKLVKEYGGWIAGIAKILNDKKISFEWTF